MDKRGRSRRSQLLCAVLLVCSAAPGWGAPVVVPPSQQEYWARLDQQDWDAAITSAQQLVDASRAANAPPDKLADALSLLGNAQLGKKDFVAAETTFGEAMKVIEPIARGADSRLIAPLEGMGFALAGQAKHAAAVTYMERALAFSRRSEGLFDPDQQDILHQLATSLTVLGQTEAADQHMRYMVRVGEHAYGAEDPRLAPLLCMIGDWYSQRGQVMDARELYRNALAIVERKLGRNDLAAVEALRSMAQSYIREVFLSNYGVRTQIDKLSASPDGSSGEVQPINPRFLNSDGERALLRALAILEANPQRSTATLVDTLLQLGDWYQVKQQPDKALPYYMRVSSMVTADPTLAGAEKEAVLGFPLQVYYPTPQLATRNLSRPQSEVVERFVQVEFTVLPDGSTKDERVVDQDATSRQASQTLEAIRAARYRPKFLQGKPVETQAVRYRQVFKQRKDKDSE
jgi:tetratricopeptide (TPR) repeat protein